MCTFQFSNTRLQTSRVRKSILRRPLIINETKLLLTAIDTHKKIYLRMLNSRDEFQLASAVYPLLYE